MGFFSFLLFLVESVALNSIAFYKSKLYLRKKEGPDIARSETLLFTF